jgi:hypothetical protein
VDAGVSREVSAYEGEAEVVVEVSETRGLKFADVGRYSRCYYKRRTIC